MWLWHVAFLRVSWCMCECFKGKRAPHAGYDCCSLPRAASATAASSWRRATSLLYLSSCSSRPPLISPFLSAFSLLSPRAVSYCTRLSIWSSVAVALFPAVVCVDIADRVAVQDRRCLQVPACTPGCPPLLFISQYHFFWRHKIECFHLMAPTPSVCCLCLHLFINKRVWGVNKIQ